MKPAYNHKEQSTQREFERLYSVLSRFLEMGGVVVTAGVTPTDPKKDLFWYDSVAGTCSRWTGKEWVQTFP